MCADAYYFPFKLGAEVTLDEFMTVLVNGPSRQPRGLAARGQAAGDVPDAHRRGERHHPRLLPGAAKPMTTRRGARGGRRFGGGAHLPEGVTREAGE